jgi:hypothetical protein
VFVTVEHGALAPQSLSVTPCSTLTSAFPSSGGLDDATSLRLRALLQRQPRLLPHRGYIHQPAMEGEKSRLRPLFCGCL